MIGVRPSHASGFLELVDRLDQLGRKISVHQHPASSPPPLPMGADKFLAGRPGYTTHDNM